MALLPGTAYGNITVSPYTGGGGSGGYYTNGANWATTAANPYVTVGSSGNSALKVSGSADIEGNLRVQGVDIGEVLSKIQDRLAILVPDPARLEKYQALKQAYEEYKILEALCVDETNSVK